MRSYKRGRIWWLEWYEEGAKRRESTGCRDAKAAEAYRRRRERELADPTHAAADQATVSSAAIRFLNELRKAKANAPETVSFYECKVGHIVRLLGAKRLSKLCAGDVEKFTDTRLEETASRNTIHKELVALRQTLKSAARAGELARDYHAIIPAWSADYTPKADTRTLEEVWAAINHLDPANGARVAFIVGFGCRRKEAELAQRDDVDEAEALIRGTKTAKSWRRVSIVSICRPFVAYALEHGNATGRLFKPWTNFRRDLHAACHRAGVRPFGALELRHTFATELARRGVPLHLLAKMLGHGSTLMLEKIYANLDARDVGMLVEQRLLEHDTKQRGAERRHNRGTATTPTEVRDEGNANEVQH